jgi:hypothetical protein
VSRGSDFARNKAQAMHPTLGPRGFGKPDERFVPSHIDTCLSFLGRCVVSDRPTVSAGQVADAIAAWAGRHVDVGYVIVASIGLGFEVTPKGRSALIGVCEGSLLAVVLQPRG